MRFSSVWMLAAICLIPPATARALTPQIVNQAKKATALVELPLSGNEKAFGSAFCIDASGLFVTNAHVADAAQAGRINLIISPGESDQRIVPARLIKADKEQDLAILQADGAKVSAPLELGQISTVFDTMDVTAFGYPFGGALAFNVNEYPAISVSTGHVTSLRKSRGILEAIQLDAVLNPGNSGGPVLDASGHVIGIVRSGVPGAGINFAVPVNRLQKMLETPAISVVPSVPIDYARRFSEHTVCVKVVGFSKPASQYAVELSIRAEGSASRVYTGQTVGGACNLAIVPVPRAGEGKSISISAKFSDGVIAGRALDHNIFVGDTAVLFSTVRMIAHATPTTWVVGLYSGRELSGVVRGLDAVVMNFGELNTTFNLSRAASISVADADGPVHSLAYRVTLRAKGDVVGEDAGFIELAGAPAPVLAAAPRRDARGGDAPPDGQGVRGQVVETAIFGGNGGGHYQSKTDPPQDVVGFRYKIGSWARRPILNTFDCLYDRSDAGQAGVIVAKPGYVVAGILVDADQYVHAVRIIFMRSTDGVLNTKDRYVSDWIGVPVSGMGAKAIAGRGEHVVGVCGHKGLNFDAIGLIVIAP